MDYQKKGWTIVGVVVFGIAVLALLVILMIPAHPDFQKQISSKEELEQIVNNETEAIFPETTMLNLKNTDCFAQLDGRSLLSTPVGYVFSGISDDSEVEIEYCFSGVPAKWDIQNKDFVYCDVPIKIVHGRKDQGSWRVSVELEFVLGDYMYNFNARYDTHGISDMEKQVIETGIMESLIQIAQQVIDDFEK